MNSTDELKRFTEYFHLYWRKIGGGSLAVSLLVHGILIGLFVVIVYESTAERPVDFIPYGTPKVSREASEQLSEAVKVKTGIRENTLLHQTRLTTTTTNPTYVSIPDEKIEGDLDQKLDDLQTKALGGGSQRAGLPQGSFRPPPAFVTVPKMFAGRCNAVDRLRKLQENGGRPECERAVSQSLEWLRLQQNPDGSWGKQHKGAMTGFALLCYLGRCYTPDNEIYGDTVMRGIQWLLETAQKNEQGIFALNPNERAASYEHGIATYALGEIYSMASKGSVALPGLREGFEKGVSTIIVHQLPDGGWGYGENYCYRDTGAGDLSVTGWQFQALKAAKYASMKNPKLHEAITHAVKYLVSKQTKDGGFGNANREQGYNQWNLTGTAVLGLQTLGDGQHKKEINRGLQFAKTYFQSEPPDWDKNANLYAWYYYAQVFFQDGGETWKQWNSTALPALLEHQGKDGSWANETPDSNIGSTSPAGADRALYRTTLCTLMLEVYYRYLKVGDREAGSLFDK
jgi:hypothetical protein